LRILRQRITSWARDRMIIAGLMSLSHKEFNSNLTSARMTQKLVAAFGSIRTTDLIHGEVQPNVHGGPWEWCPQSLFDFGLSFSGSDPTDDFCFVTKSGRLRGRFLAYEATQRDTILPYGLHPAHKARITVALSDRKQCLLLTTEHIIKSRIFILFRPVYVHRNVVVGNWVGCVTLQVPPDATPLSRVITENVGGQEFILTEGRLPLFNSLPMRMFQFGSNVSPLKGMLPALDLHNLYWSLKSSQTMNWDSNGTRIFLTDSYDDSEAQVRYWPASVLLHPSI
jgi:hypothetical protein